MNLFSPTRVILILLALPVFLYGQPGTARLLTLDELLQLGMANSKQLQVSSAKLAAAHARTGQTRDATIPSLIYTGSYTRLSENIEPFTIRLPDGSERILNPVIPNQFGNRLSLSEPVFTGFRALNTIKATEFLENAVRFDMEKDKKDVQLNLLNAAINLYKLQEARRVFDQSLATAQSRLTDVRNLRAQGLALDNDVLKADLSVAQLETLRAETDNTLAAAQYGLRIMLGLPDNTTVAIDSASLFTGMLAAEGLDALIDNAGSRADIQAATQRGLAAQKQIEVNKGVRLPIVSVGANVYTNRPNQRQFPPEDQFLSTWDAGLTVSWNISSLYSARHSIQEGKLNFLQSNFQRDQLSDAARTEIASSFYAWQTAQQKIALSEKSVLQASENQRITQLRTGQQIASVTERLDADALLLQTQVNQITARADARMAYFKLLKSAGRL